MSSYSFQGDKRVWTPRDVEEDRPKRMPVESKPIYFENVHESEKWSLNQILCLLRLYGYHRCLWDVRSEDNRNRKLRKAALVDIAAAISDETTSSEVARKINVLRATYRYERRRIKFRMRKGMGAKTKLKWFTLADSFLREVPKIGKLRKRNEVSESDSDLENEMVLTIDPGEVVPMESDNTQIEGSSSSIKLENDQISYEMNVRSCSDNDDLVSENPFENEHLQLKWTSDHSVKFVQLLKSQPILWSNVMHENTMQQDTALKLIAEELKLPISRIRCRVKKFKSICTEEFKKMRQLLNYKPQFSWWAIAETFMIDEEKQLELENFVDANAVLPPTPMQNQSECDNYAMSQGTPINPIPSVSVLSVVEDDIEENLEKLLSTVEFEGEDTATSSSTQPTKLIWNGLTDDLLEGKWSLKHSVKFLRLYGTHRCLWDLTDPDYRSRELRAAAIEDIAAAMGYGLDADYVAKKIKIFRITYMQHRKRMLEAIKSGQEPDIQLRWFPLADSFLRPHIGLRSIKEHEREIPQFDFQYVMANLNLIDPDLLNDFRDKIPKNFNSTTQMDQLHCKNTFRNDFSKQEEERA